ncbi:transglycosylase [Brevundimonas sp.]|uniref:transglycosylase n=1 Tax=Brevundimonas sp. TaxID=1871086 RepID=UPI001D3382CE|nr:transglycosylase [Caulobacteraceae bacterium]HEV7228197.1 transglycosylase [Brevundimonas sp.]
MEHLDVVVALVAVLGLAVVADQLTGRRSLDQALLVGGVGAISGAFLHLRVFAAGTMDGWGWVGWSVIGAVLCLFAHFLFRGKR